MTKLTLSIAVVATSLMNVAPAQNQAAPPAAKAPAAPAAAKPAEQKKPAAPATGAEAKPDAPAKPAETKKPKKKSPLDKAREETEKLAAENALFQERERKKSAGLRAEIARLKLEKEVLNERLSLESTKRAVAEQETLRKHSEQKKKLEMESALAKAKADLLINKLKALQTESTLKTSTMLAHINEVETKKKREAYADRKPVYLDNPLKKDGTLVISDRRITMNDAVTTRTADHVTERINYFNNKDPKKPIFIVIDASPGGSVMAGYRILKAMEGSEAPVYVVVKSFAASMAATIATLAEKSYAYPNAVFLHHQISSTVFGRMNLTEQEEFYKESQEWWKRLATPIAQKMGISTKEFIRRMYEKSSSGDWTEFATEAKKLKWVDHTVERIHETSLLKNPDVKTATATTTTTRRSELKEEINEKGEAVMYLPRLSPKDYYFLYNPDKYYRVR